MPLGNLSRISFGSLPLVGREVELARLRSCLNQVENERAGVVLLLRGAGGVGKTRLVRSLAAEAEDRGWTTAVGCAYSSEVAVPYAVVGDAFSTLLRSLPAATLDVLTRGERFELARVCPGVLPVSGPEPTVAAGDGGELRARLCWIFARFVERLAEQRPLLVTLENLQWADASSLELAHFLARHIAGAPVLLVGTYNEAERDLNPALSPFEQSLITQRIASVERLQPLARSAVQELIDETFGVAPTLTGEFVEWLAKRTRGNPFFIEETLRSLIDSRRLRFEHGTWIGWETRVRSIPRSLRDTIVARLSRLSPTTRAVANLAAVLGARIPYDALATLSGLEAAQLVAALDELCRHDVLLPIHARAGMASESTGPVYDFAQPMLRATIYAELGAAQARLLHMRVAEGLEAHYGPHATDHADKLAFHLVRSGGRVADSRVLRYLAIAAEHAVARRAYLVGAAYFASALAQAERSDSATAPIAGTRPLDLLLALAWAQQMAGKLDQASMLYERAISQARSTGDIDCGARAELGAAVTFFASGRIRESLDHSVSGIELAENGQLAALALRLRHWKAVSLVSLGHLADARSELEAIAKAANAAGNLRLLALAAGLEHSVELWSGHTEAARAAGHRAVQLALESGLPERAVLAHFFLSILEMWCGDGDALREHVAACRELAKLSGSPLLAMIAAEADGFRAFTEGEWDVGRDLIEGAVDSARTFGSHVILARLLAWRALLDMSVGDFERTRLALDEAASVAGITRGNFKNVDVHAVIPVLSTQAEYHLAVGDLARAGPLAESALSLVDRSGCVAWGVAVLPVLVRTYLDAGDMERADKSIDRLRACGKRYGFGLATRLAAGFHGMVLAARGKPAAAAHQLRHARDALRASGSLWNAARFSIPLANALHEAGDTKSAVRELRAVHDFFERVGAEPQLRRVREQLRKLNVRPPAHHTVSELIKGSDSLTAREKELIGLVSEGKSNKDIASLLDISPRTVSTHLTSAYPKLGIHSRGELIAQHRISRRTPDAPRGSKETTG